MSEWMQAFLRWLGRPLPENYLVFDTETTGFKAGYDLPIDIGHVIVRDRQVVQRGNFLLNWADYPGIEPAWLEDRFDRIQQQMAPKGQTFHYSVERLRREGKDPAKVLSFYRTLLQRNREADASIVGHNAWSFDVGILQHAARETLDQDVPFEDAELYDTGCLFKASQLNLLPATGETLRAFFQRVQHVSAKGVYWNLAHCIQHFGLDASYRLDPGEAHQAGYDAYCSHLVFENLRTNFAVSKVA